MKYLIILLFPFFGFSQEAPKGATIISAKTHANMDSIELVLFSRGFTVDTKNANIGVIVTKPKQLNGIQGTVIARIILKDSIVVITGECSLNMEIGFGGDVTITGKNSFIKVKNTGSKRSTMRNSWEALNNIAKQLGWDLQYQ